MNTNSIELNAEFQDYLHDESRLVGMASSISFPKAESDVIEIMKRLSPLKQVITIQGARTGITAGAVPLGGHIINLSRMNSIGEATHDSERDTYVQDVQPGAILTEIRDKLHDTGLFFPPDPTETSASIGGMVACNASGALTYRYGATRDWINSLRIVLADSSVISIRRGTCFADGRSFNIATTNGRRISGVLPSYNMPKVKSAAGYYVADNMDMIDLFIGMEGTLGIVTDIELILTKKPLFVNGLTVFLPSEESALHFVHMLKGDQSEIAGRLPIEPVAIEYFDKNSLDLMRRMKKDYQSFADVPSLHEHFVCAVYAELHSNGADLMDETIMEIIDAIGECGGSDEDTWFATNERELEVHKSFRHAIPEAVNLLVDERKKSDSTITKLGTDMAVPDDKLDYVIDMYNRGLSDSNLEFVKFGHIGDNHLHVNIIPRNHDEYLIGKELYMKWAKEIVAMGGSVSAEHGIGKLKKDFLRLMYGDEGIAQMKALKQLFDPDFILNRGNLFDI